jgi:cardiolipin hydrolase
VISCRRCGRQLPETARFCDQCGLQDPAPVKPEPTPITFEPTPTPIVTEEAIPKPRVRMPTVRLSRRVAFAALIIIVLVAIGAAGAFLPATTTTRYITNTLYVTTTQSQPVTLTELQTLTATGAQTHLVEYCFSPGGNCANVLIRWISSARTSIHVLIYSFTLDNVRDALIQAKNRGVDVKIVFDEEQARGRGSEYSNLKAAGVDVRVDTGSGLMHDKVAIIDNHIIITGSFNWSQAGNQENNENLIVIDNSSWASAYEHQFQLIYNAASASTIAGAFTTVTHAGAQTTQIMTSATPGTTQIITSATLGPSCDPSYPTVCIPPPPPDLDCKDIPYRNFPVLPPDPHRFDGDKDGIGCET